MKIKGKKFILLMLVLSIIIGIFSMAATAVNKISVSEIGTATVIEENKLLRKEFEKHFVMSDGSYTVATYGEPIHKLVNNEWVEIDNTLKLTKSEKGSCYKTVDGLTDVSFAKTYQSNDLVTVKQDEYSVSWGIVAVSNSLDKMETSSVKNNVMASVSTSKTTDINVEEQKLMANKSTSAIKYSNALAYDVDLEYVVLPSRVKESIVLNSKKDITSYILNVYTQNLSARLLENRRIEFFNSDGIVTFSMWAPYMYDSGAELSEDIDVKLTEIESDHYIVTITPDAEWLNASERVYPVTIDPDVSASRVRQNIIDNYVWEGHGNQDENLDRMYIGNKSGKKARAYFKYKTMPTIPSGATITAATQRVNILSGTTSANTANAYKVDSDWDSATITWSNKPAASTKLASNIGHHSMSYYSFSCLSAVKAWYNGSTTGKKSNYGIMMRYSDETISDYNSFYSSDCSTESKRPLLKITYTEPTNNTIYWPVDGYYTITSKWGYRTFDNAVHTAIDIACTNVPVVAAISGTVKIFNAGSGGNGMSITKPNSEFNVRYYHLSSYQKTSGSVTAGTRVATSGSTGTVSGPHLHLQLQWGDDKTKSYNPIETYHADDKRSSWTNPNPMYKLKNGKYVPNNSFNTTYTASDYNSTSTSWKK